MSTKFTPGPWHVGPMSKTIRPEVTQPGTSGRNGGFIIAELYGADQADNARLIAVAPELLEALKYSRRFLNAADHDVAFVDAAIAAATGDNS